MLADVRRMAEQPGGDAGEKQTEALEHNPGPLSFSCYVTATFALGK